MLTRPAPSRPRPRPHTPRPRPWHQGQGQGLGLIPLCGAKDHEFPWHQGQGHGIKTKAVASRSRHRPHTPRSRYDARPGSTKQNE